MPPGGDAEVLRGLAGRAREIAELPEMGRRIGSWKRFNALRPDRPMVLCFPEGAWEELLPPSALECADPLLRRWEQSLRSRLYWWERLRDDSAVEPWFDIPWIIHPGSFGVEPREEQGGGRGSYHYAPVITDLDAEMVRLHRRLPTVDRAETRRQAALADDIFGDLLPARVRGSTYWPLSITWEAIKLIGMDALFLLMYDNPGALRRLLGLIQEDQDAYHDWLEREGLVTLDNGCNYVGTGGVGCTDELPRAERRPGEPLGLADVWGTTDSQETIGVSPEMFGDMIFPLQAPFLSRFGLACYGCCEPIEDRWRFLATLPNLRRVSVSPWSDQGRMAEHLGRRYIFSRKPNPTLVCTSFDEEAIRADLRATLRVARGCVLEIILKDTHTVEHRPERLSRWVRIALEEVQSS
jgi:hypothetical protein